MSKKPTWNDLHQAHPKELMRVYKLDERGLNKAVRDHSNDIKCATERRKFYETVYNNKR